jgi:hypothetical protein
MWTARIIHEASLHEYDHGNSFITLTYDNDNVPPDYSLRKEDFQKFMKRLRKKHDQRIRFYHCGEYGEICKHGHHVDDCDFCNVGRPHYHAILFNCSFDDLEKVGQRNGIPHYSSRRLADIWKLGNVQVGEVTADSAGYVARYCLKKVNGLNQESHYSSVDPITGELTYVCPEYSTMSRNKGIAHEWYEKYKEDLFPADMTPIMGKKPAFGVPRYYMEKLKEDDELLAQAVKERRILFRDEHADEYTSQRLIDKYKVKKAQIKSLKRELNE